MQDRIDQIAAVILGLSVFVGLVYWIGVWMPARDAYLFATNDCYIERGCQDFTSRPDHEECWETCGDSVRAMLVRGNQ